MKKILKIAAAVIVFLVALVLLRPAPSQAVVVAAYDLPAGHVIEGGDILLKPLPADVIAPDALVDTALAIGQSLRIDRGQGDVIRESQLGEVVQLQPDERAIAVQVTDPSGMAGLLAPGMQVGVVATINRNDLDGQGSFSKAAIEGLRVLYLDPRFAAKRPDAIQSAATPDDPLSGLNTDERAREGAVILAAPVDLQTVLYDFSAEGGISETRKVSALELLAALGSTDSARVTLYLMPSGTTNKLSSPGLWLPDLIVTPRPTPTPIPTATPTPGG